MGDLKKALAEQVLQAELDVHLNNDDERKAGNHRNGTGKKSVLTDGGKIVLDIPRDRHGRFDPASIQKCQRRSPSFDEKIISLYASGMSTLDIRDHVGELYGVSITADLVIAVTAAMIDEVKAWQQRPLASTYALVFFDALRVNIRDE